MQRKGFETRVAAALCVVLASSVAAAQTANAPEAPTVAEPAPPAPMTPALPAESPHDAAPAPSAEPPPSDTSASPVTEPPRAVAGAPQPVQLAAPEPARPCGCVWPKGAYRHDGYYQRLSLLLGHQSTWGEGPYGHASVSGFARGVEVSIGGTPLSGFAIGAAIGFQTVFSEFHGGPIAARGDASMTQVRLGLFADWYPRPTGMLHFGGSFGLGGVSGTDAANRDYLTEVPSASLFGGVDLWIGPQFSIGYALVLGADASGKAHDSRDNDTGYRFATAFALLSWSIVYH